MSGVCIFAAGIYLGAGCVYFDQLCDLNPDTPRWVLVGAAAIWPGIVAWTAFGKPKAPR